MILHRSDKHLQRPAGFSLIEIMIAVVVLATGMLALAALQGALARNSADAKARGAVMAALNSRMNEIRQAGAGIDGKTWTSADNENWFLDAEKGSGATDLAIAESIQTLYWDKATSKYVEDEVEDTDSTYIHAQLQAEWTPASGVKKQLALSSDISRNIYGDGKGYPVPDPNGSAAKKPIVRRANPASEAGVIPIAYGTDQGAQSTAASNPKPIKVGSTTVVGTQFDVLTYVPEGSSANSAIIRRRIDTNLVKCKCSTGLADNQRYSVDGEAQWPTVWNGDAYETYKPSDDSDPPGEALKAGEAGGNEPKTRTQSALCTECCRDHHDTDAMAVRFSPEGGTDRYNLNGGVLSVSTSGDFVAACRVIRSNGIYKTSSDMYLRQFGLLETSPVPDTSTAAKDYAKSGVPKQAQTTNYGNFVKQYLTGYFTSVATTGAAPTTPADAQTAFNNFAIAGVSGILNTPANIEIPAKGSSDIRYLHARGLYVDHLTQAARTRIQSLCGSGTNLDCLLPHLAFTTINLTELADWSASDTKLNVTASGTLLSPVAAPSGGATYGLDATASSYTNAAASLSNSTLAFRNDIPFTNTSEANSSNWLTDTQQFSVGGTPSGGGGGDLPYIDVYPDGLLSAYSSLNSVTVSMSLNGAPTTPCDVKSGFYRCHGGSVGALPANVGLVIANYNVKESNEQVLESVNATCVDKTLSQKRPYTITYSGLAVSQTSGAAAVGDVDYSPTPFTARGIPQTAAWGSLSLGHQSILYLGFSEGERQCPTVAYCQVNGSGKIQNKFDSWGTTYSAAACSNTSYTGIAKP